MTQDASAIEAAPAASADAGGLASTAAAPGRFAPDDASHPPGCSHLVRFYEDDAELATSVAAFIGEGLPAGERVVVIATDAHTRVFRERLRADGVDEAAACARG